MLRLHILPGLQPRARTSLGGRPGMPEQCPGMLEDVSCLSIPGRACPGKFSFFSYEVASCCHLWVKSVTPKCLSLQFRQPKDTSDDFSGSEKPSEVPGFEVVTVKSVFGVKKDWSDDPWS